jgi:hypothetical protein
VVELKLCLENLERERDFYFGKLRDIEVLHCMHCCAMGSNISWVAQMVRDHL